MYDLVIRNGRVATALEVVEADIGISRGIVTALAQQLPDGRETIDAKGRIVTPGGVDSHCHIEQLAASGMMNADTFETATRAAALGGTTTVIPFAAQHVGMSLKQVVEDYHRAADRGAMVDYAFHMIVTDPRAEVMRDELPALVRDGHASLKCFLTYDRLRVHDEQFLDVLAAARAQGCMVCVHAENHGMITWMGKRLIERGYHRPIYHVPSHPRLGEQEAINRAISMAALIDQPLMIFHVSTAEGLAVIRRWQGDGQKVFGETCTQYLTMTSHDLERPGIEGAKWICSPPLRDADDGRALWDGLRQGVLSTVSSDHAPYGMDETGKLAQGEEPHFKQIANGMGGIGLRMPVLFDRMVADGMLGLNAFVRLTATEPARIYGLHPRKGTIAIGSDAD
ncbi:MAG: dihydropyrimidinase, partial [Geminicoccaceae bacterium]|nr:dihydropyrimidinase [Geminicoccaceae bacterium]